MRNPDLTQYGRMIVGLETIRDALSLVAGDQPDIPARLKRDEWLVLAVDMCLVGRGDLVDEPPSKDGVWTG